MTQIGQNDPLAPAAAQIPTHSSDAIAARAGAMGQARPRHLARADPRRAATGAAGQVLEQAIELGVGARRVGGVQALVELLRRQPPGRRVRAELARDLLALGVGGRTARSGWSTDQMLGVVRSRWRRCMRLQHHRGKRVPAAPGGPPRR